MHDATLLYYKNFQCILCISRILVLYPSLFIVHEPKPCYLIEQALKYILMFYRASTAWPYSLLSKASVPCMCAFTG